MWLKPNTCPKRVENHSHSLRLDAIHNSPRSNALQYFYLTPSTWNYDDKRVGPRLRTNFKRGLMSIIQNRVWTRLMLHFSLRSIAFPHGNAIRRV